MQVDLSQPNETAPTTALVRWAAVDNSTRRCRARSTMRPLIVVALLVLATIMAGCSGSSSSDSGDKPTSESVVDKVGLIQREDGAWRMSGHDSLHSNRINAPSIETPEIKWEKKLSHRILAGAAIGEDGTVYVSAEGERFESAGHGLFAFTSGGEQVWSLALPAPIRTTSLLQGDSILFGSYDGAFQSVSLAGQRLWRYDPEDLSHRISLSSPATARDGTIYFGDHGGSLQAVSFDGARVWSYATNDYVRAAPSIARDGTVYVGSNDGTFYALNPDGTLKWSFETGGRIDSPAAIALDDTVYFGSADGKLYALTPEGVEKWAVPVGKGLMVFTSPALGHDGTIYVGTTGTAPLGSSQPQQTAAFPFMAISPDGAVKWEFPLTQWIRSSPAVVSDGTVYFGGWDGTLYALTPQGELKWELSLGDIPVEQAIEAPPAVAHDGTIFIGTWDGRFFAIGESE